MRFATCFLAAGFTASCSLLALIIYSSKYRFLIVKSPYCQTSWKSDWGLVLVLRKATTLCLNQAGQANVLANARS